MNEQLTNKEELAERLARLIVKAYDRPFTFLLLGRTGVGKSSTINSLLQAEVAKTDAFRRGTHEVTLHSQVVRGITFNVYDTPGFFDAPLESGNNKKYVQKIRDSVKSVDCVLYVTELDKTRVDYAELETFNIIDQALGRDVWKKMVIVFTKEDLVGDRRDYFLNGRSAALKEAFAKETKINIDLDKIPKATINNTAPNQNYRLGELYSEVVSVVDDNAIGSLIVPSTEVIEYQQGSHEVAKLQGELDKAHKKLEIARATSRERARIIKEKSKIIVSSKSEQKIEKRINNSIFGGVNISFKALNDTVINAKESVKAGVSALVKAVSSLF